MQNIKELSNKLIIAAASPSYDYFTINYDTRLNNRIDGLLEAKAEARMAWPKTLKRIEDAEQGCAQKIKELPTKLLIAAANPSCDF